MSPAAVRRVRPDEYERVADLTAGVYGPEGYSSPGYERELRATADRDSDAVVLVAVSGSRVVGAVTVATRGGVWAEAAAPGEAVIRMLAVDPGSRRTGVGESLVRACLDRAREDDCSLVRLWTEPTMAPAHRLYERLGFTRTPSYDRSPGGLDLLGFALVLLPWCDQCGTELTPEGHDPCRAGLDPPRYCGQCRRRMVVQVTPTGWTARCVEHGTRTS
jgi:ribosomal protein S18 acetylase RimI-like enzyme